MTEIFRVVHEGESGLKSAMKKIERAIDLADGKPLQITVYVDNEDAKAGFIQYIQQKYGENNVQIFRDDLDAGAIGESQKLHIFDVDYQKWGAAINMGRPFYARERRPKAPFPGGNTTFFLTPPPLVDPERRPDGKYIQPDFQTNAPDTADYSSTVIQWGYSQEDVQLYLANSASS